MRRTLTMIVGVLAMLAADVRAETEPPRRPDVLRSVRTADGVARVALWSNERAGIVTVERGQRLWTSSLLPIWHLEVADLDGDETDEIVMGMWSSRGAQSGATRRTIWVMRIEDGALAPVWRGSQLPDPFETFSFRRKKGRDFLVTRATGPGLPATIYQWTGFGFHVSARVPLPAARLTFVGDTSVVRAGPRGRRTTPPGRQALDATAASDLVIANLEAGVGDPEAESSSPTGRVQLTVTEDELDWLVHWGVDSVTTSNNHRADADPSHLVESLASRALPDLSNATLTLGGRRLRIIAATLRPPLVTRGAAFIPDDEEDTFVHMAEDVASRGDVTIASIHGGKEGSRRPTQRQRRLTRRLADAGVDVIVWHGSHRAGHVERIEGAIVAWNLGDFAHRTDSNDGCALHLSIPEHGPIDVLSGPWSCRRAEPSKRGPT